MLRFFNVHGYVRCCSQAFRGAPQFGHSVAVSGIRLSQYLHGIMATSFSFTAVGVVAGRITWSSIVSLVTSGRPLIATTPLIDQ